MILNALEDLSSGSRSQIEIKFMVLSVSDFGGGASLGQVWGIMLQPIVGTGSLACCEKELMFSTWSRLVSILLWKGI